jgi:hypothetical protein
MAALLSSWIAMTTRLSFAIASGLTIQVVAATVAMAAFRLALLGVASFAFVGIISAVNGYRQGVKTATDSTKELREAMSKPGDLEGLIKARDHLIEVRDAAQQTVDAYYSKNLIGKFFSPGEALEAQVLSKSMQGIADNAEEADAATRKLTGQVITYLTKASTLDQVGTFQAFDTAAERADALAKALPTLTKAGVVAGDSFQVIQEKMAAFNAEQERVAAKGPAAGDAMAGVADNADELQKELETLAEAMSTFSDPLGTYTSLLEEKKKKEQESAEATAASTKSSKDSWKDYVKEASLSLDEYSAKLEQQTIDAQNWQKNLVIVAQRAGLEVAMHLQQMGQEGVTLTAQMANGTDRETKRAADAITNNMAIGGVGAANALKVGLDIAAINGREGGKATAAAIATELRISVDQVAAIAAQYSIKLTEGVNPVLEGIGKTKVALGFSKSFQSKLDQMADGGILEAYANGGVREDHVAQIAKGGEWRVWAEDETGGEAYIPLSPTKRKRSVEIWEETGRRLNAFAAGGFATSADVPPVPEPPRGGLVNQAGWEANQLQNQAVVQFMDQNAPGLAGGSFNAGGGSSPNGSGGLGPSAAAARQFVMQTFGISNIGGYSYRNIAGTNTLSDHALGKAIDVMIANYKSPPQIALGNRVASHFVTNPGQFGTKYVIWRDQINSGGGWRGYGHPGGGGDTLQHRDHVHISFRRDGAILDSLQSAANNKTLDMPRMHSGGLVSSTWPSMRGLAQDERAAVLQVGERVTPRFQVQAEQRSQGLSKGDIAQLVAAVASSQPANITVQHNSQRASATDIVDEAYHAARVNRMGGRR